MIELAVNGRSVRVDADPDTPLLWVLREQLGLTGTKFGCGIAMCGACTVHLNGAAIRSCVFPAVAAVGSQITTIEALAHAVQEAWIEEQVPQCGYCQSGQLMAAAALLASTPNPTDADIDAQMTNLCRCATYDRIRRGIHKAAAMVAASAEVPATEGSPPSEAGAASTSEAPAPSDAAPAGAP